MKIKTVYLLKAVLAVCLLFSACASIRKPKKEEFIVDISKPSIELGGIEAQFDKFLGTFGLRKTKISLSYIPANDAVCLSYKQELINYQQYWSKAGRDAFIEALAKYNEDYDARALKKDAKSLKKYNVVQGYLAWYLHRYSAKSNANMNVELGYFFREKSPYFTVNQREAEYVDLNGTGSEFAVGLSKSCPPIKIYYTRAQAAELAAFFDQSFLEATEQGKNKDTSVYFDENDVRMDGY